MTESFEPLSERRPLRQFCTTLIELLKQDVACVEVKSPDSFLGGEVSIELAEELRLQVEVVLCPCLR